MTPGAASASSSGVGCVGSTALIAFSTRRIGVSLSAHSSSGPPRVSMRTPGRLPGCGSRGGPFCSCHSGLSSGSMSAISSNGSVSCVGTSAFHSASMSGVGSAPVANANSRRKSRACGLNNRLIVGAPNGLNGTMKLLNSPLQSNSRSLPVFPSRTSRPAPP